jgi:DNA-binding beta-propeller fold protein YncE
MNTSRPALSLWGLVLSLAAIVIVGSAHSPAVGAAPTVPALKLVRTLDTNDVFSEAFFSAGRPDLAGLGFPPGAHTLLLLNQPSGQVSLVLTAPPTGPTGAMTRTRLAISDPINMAFDSVSRGAKGYGQARLFVLDSELGELITIQAGPQDIMEPSRIRRVDAHGFGIVNPQGMTVEPATGRLWVLEGAGTPHLVSLQPKPGHQFAKAEISRIALPAGMGHLRGIAFNPADGYVYLLSTEQQKLYKVNAAGKVAASLGVSGASIGVAQGLVFAPSLDHTDHPSIYHLYLATEQGLTGESTEWALPGPF